jgi:type I restriction enzyme, S subunit
VVTAEVVSEAGLPYAGRVVPQGGVMMSFKLTVGRVARAGIDLLTNEAIVSIAGRPAVADDRWLYHALPTIASGGVTDTAVKGATLNKFKLERLRVLVPPLEEQRRIAEILDTIDETIQATERVIAKLEVGRQGLLDDLLGAIEHHEQLGEALDRIDAGWSPTCAERPPTGSEWGVLKVSSITKEEFNPAESKTLPTSLPPRPDLIVRVGDVLTARANGVADLVGRTAFVDRLGGRNLLISDKTLRLVPGPKLSPRYLSYCMQHETVRSQVRGLVSGSTGQGNISQAELRSLRLAIPPRPDQHAIETAVTSVDDRLDAERSALSKLHRLQAGLAADLLSGRVRMVAA